MSSIKRKLMEILESHSSEYTTCATLSQSIQIEKEAIPEHIEQLKQEGCIIEGDAIRGYRIIQIPDDIKGKMIQQTLTTEWLGQSVFYRDSIPSTQILAHEEARNGKEHGTIVIANEQTEGKGQKGRQWHSTKNKGLWMSIILRPGFLMQQASQLTLLTATVLADVLAPVTRKRVTIKWPNDILLNDKKIAGILTEVKTSQAHMKYVVIGVGLNVHQRPNDLPSDIEQKASSLLIETDEHHDIISLIKEIVCTFEKSYKTFIHEGFAMIKAKWEQYGYRMGRKIRVNTMKQSYGAIFYGIDSDGALLVKHNGQIDKLYSAEIDWYTPVKQNDNRTSC